MIWVDIMFVAGLLVGYLAGWAHRNQYRRKPLQRVFWTHTPDAFPLGSVADGWRVISLDREASTRLESGGAAPCWRVTTEAAE